VLDPADLLRAYDERLRGCEATDEPEGALVERDGPLLRIAGGLRGFISAPADLGVDGAELDALIARQRDVFALRGQSVEWKTRAHDRPVSLLRRLRAAGFVPEEEETVLVGLAAPLTAAGDPPEGVVLRRTSELGDFERIAALQSEIWQADWSGIAEDLRGRSSAGGERFAVFVAEAGGRLVAAAWVALRPEAGFACLWGGSTHPEFRRRGIYHALVARRAELALAAGIPYLQVDASSASRPILERLGFVRITTTTPYVWSPPS